ncbi:MAG TPA: hypothetical protein PKG95_00295 [Anaerolineaceae bacterium]|nr:hypothetical protein [Anaerolineaceae bacterium]
MTRLGLHYFPDTLHYRQSDLAIWLPELHGLGVSWLALQTEISRAIPEFFLRSLIGAGITPILQFQLSLSQPPSCRELLPLFQVYHRWGVQYIVLFEQPNQSSAWLEAEWLREDLVERTLDRYLTLAEIALEHGLLPVFPPLAPGGSYWDLSFLTAALQSLQRRQKKHLLETLVLAAYAHDGGHPLDWGLGGPLRWPEVRPYLTPEKSEDQCGFRNHEWVQAIVIEQLGATRPMLLLEAGKDMTIAAQLAAAKLVHGQSGTAPDHQSPVPAPLATEVLGCCFWLLSTPPASPAAGLGWYSADGNPGFLADQVKAWPQPPAAKKSPAGFPRPIKRYVLLPGYDWGIADWHFEAIRPYVKKYRPAIGFSVAEAALAENVLVIGGEKDFPEELLNHLRQIGCRVERINETGTTLATILAER